jgi:hypothetical protein
MVSWSVVFAALEKAGVVGDASQVNRVVIDAQRGAMTTVHIELVGDSDSVLEVIHELGGAQVRWRREEPDDPRGTLEVKVPRIGQAGETPGSGGGSGGSPPP